MLKKDLSRTAGVLSQRTIAGNCILICALAAGCLASTAALAARKDDKPQVVTIKEIDKDKGQHDLNEKSRIVDADSELVIKIDKDQLRAKVKESSPAVQALIKRANLMRDTSIEGLQLLPQLQSRLTAWLTNPAAPESDQQFAEIRVKVASLRLRILRDAVSGQSPLRDRINATLDQASTVQGTVPKYIAISRAVFQSASDEAERINKDVDDAIKKDAVLIQMGAFIAGKQKHLEGWDDYPNDPRTQLGTRTLVLTPADRAALDALASTAKGLNDELGTKSITDVLLEQLRAVTDTLKVQLKDYLQSPPCVKTVRDSAEAVKTAFGADETTIKSKAESALQTFKSSVDAVSASLTAFDQSLSGLRDRYVTGAGAAATPSEFLTTANSDLALLVSSVQALTGGLKQQYAALQGVVNGLPNEVRTTLQLPKALQDLNAALLDCGAKLEAQATGLLSSARNMLDSFLFGQHTSNALAEFGDKTRSLELENVPEETHFELQNASRSYGDSLRVVVATLKSGQSRKTLETRDFLLYPVNWRIDTAVGIVFANHSGKFQAAPSYSWLYKRGSRRSVVYNQLLDFGAGVNVSALDFNHDDTPELGIAFSVSIFRNFIQGGYGFNVQQRQPYAFFGLKLPLPSR
jgi:hypothetical protein